MINATLLPLSRSSAEAKFLNRVQRTYFSHKVPSTLISGLPNSSQSLVTVEVVEVGSPTHFWPCPVLLSFVQLAFHFSNHMDQNTRNGLVCSICCFVRGRSPVMSGAGNTIYRKTLLGSSLSKTLTDKVWRAVSRLHFISVLPTLQAADGTLTLEQAQEIYLQFFRSTEVVLASRARAREGDKKAKKLNFSVNLTLSGVFLSVRHTWLLGRGGYTRIGTANPFGAFSCKRLSFPTPSDRQNP